MMTKKHFNAIAAEIRVHVQAAVQSGNTEARDLLLSLAAALAREFKADNHNFNTTRFMVACAF